MPDLHVVLAGGGHAHALLIRELGLKRQPDISYTLVSPDPYTPYSGMLPGLITGHYGYEEVHIDLEKLCHWAGVKFIRAAVHAIDSDNRCVHTNANQHIPYDLLSLDTGSTPDTSVPGVSEHAIGVKPISGFWQRWQTIKSDLITTALSDKNHGRPKIAVVGGGAGAVEIVLAMAWACRQIENLSLEPSFCLLSKTDSVLSGYPAKVQSVARLACIEMGVEIKESCDVMKVDSDQLLTHKGDVIKTDVVFWCTQASAPSWPRQSGIACDDNGFVCVNPCLQSVSHPTIFAAGDLAHSAEHPRPKAGVYAVRQAPFLATNIHNWLQGLPMSPYIPQNKFLSILALGDKYAVGSRGGFSFHGRWMWWLKNRIDKSFMHEFENLPG